MSFNEQLKRAELLAGILADGAGYEAELVGGALRVQALGGETGDFDIAVIVDDSDELEALRGVGPSNGRRSSGPQPTRVD